MSVSAIFASFRTEDYCLVITPQLVLLDTIYAGRKFCGTSVKLTCISELLRCRQHGSENQEFTSRSTPYRRTEALVLSFN